MLESQREREGKKEKEREWERRREGTECSGPEIFIESSEEPVDRAVNE